VWVCVGVGCVGMCGCVGPWGCVGMCRRVWVWGYVGYVGVCNVIGIPEKDVWVHSLLDPLLLLHVTLP